MSILTSIKQWAVGKVLGHYEAAVRYTRDRGWIRGWVQDARFDATSATRFEIVRKSRHFERNNGIAIRMAEVFAQYTVGPNGIVFAPASSDDDWNLAAALVLKKWGRFCDLASRQSFGALQSICAHRLFFDGEVFILKKYEKVNGRWLPRLQLLETQRISTPPDRWGLPDVNIHDGVEVDDYGRPVAYWCKDEFTGADFKRIPAADVFHIFDQDRPGQLRGLPFLTPVVNELADLEELEKLTMRVAKKQASISAIFKTRSSQLPSHQIRATRLTQSQTLNTGDHVTNERVQAMADTYGGDVISIFNDEEMVLPPSETPTVAQREHWDYLVSKVCCIGIPKLLVFPHSMQGTVARADLDTADAWFKSRSQPLTDAFERIVTWVLDWESFTEPTIARKPDDWGSITSRPPRSVNVDVGRKSDAMLKELEAGTLTLEDCVAPYGRDWRDVVTQKAKEAAFIMQVAQDNGVPVAMVSSLTNASMKAQPQQPAKPTDAPQQTDSIAA